MKAIMDEIVKIVKSEGAINENKKVYTKEANEP
jgi:hypothetical protein